MKRPPLACLLTFASLLALAENRMPAHEPVLEPIPLWPGLAPGDDGKLGPEHDSTKHDPNAKPRTEVIRLANVSTPTVTVYRPEPDRANGTAIVVCPGGGYHILAWDLEGTEVCEWLKGLGVTAVLLKYRVPGRGAQRHTASLQDAQRALGLVRHRAREWNLDPQRIGILGFSAGGHLAAAASNQFETRSYPPLDDADRTSCRPDFTVLIYPAYLVVKENPSKLAPEIAVSAATPPAFMVMTQDDQIGVENVFTYGLALKAVKVPFEAHVYPKGGHGYGLRPSAHAVSTWPQRAEEWLARRGLLKAK